MCSGLSQWFDAGVNLFTTTFNATACLPHINSYITTSTSTSSNITSYGATASFSYLGWSLFDPNASPVGNATFADLPGPKFSTEAHIGALTNTTYTEVRSGGFTQSWTYIQNLYNGQSSTTATSTMTGQTTAGATVTASYSSTTSSTGTQTSTWQGTAGYGNSYIYCQNSTSTSGNSTTNTTSVGVHAEASTPSFWGWFISISADLNVGVKTP